MALNDINAVLITNEDKSQCDVVDTNPYCLYPRGTNVRHNWANKITGVHIEIGIRIKGGELPQAQRGIGYGSERSP